MSDAALILELDRDGVVGDRHRGPTLIAGPRQRGVTRGTVLPNTRQVSLVSVEETARVAAALGLQTIAPEWLSANVALSGAPELSAWPKGARLRFASGALIEVEGENEPCRKAGAAISRAVGRDVALPFVKAATGLRGVVGFVVEPGALTVGMAVTIVC